MHGSGIIGGEYRNNVETRESWTRILVGPSLMSLVKVKCMVLLCHKGEIAPLYIGIVVVGQHPAPYIWKIRVSVAIGTQSGIRLHERVAMVKIWGSSKNYQNRITGKLLKL